MLEPRWWHCYHCDTNIRSSTEPWQCTMCHGTDIRELWITDPPPNQGQLFYRGSVDQDMIHPDDDEAYARRVVSDLMRLREQLALTDDDRRRLSQRAIPARAHWIPFGAFIHNGQSVGIARPVGR